MYFVWSVAAGVTRHIANQFHVMLICNTRGCWGNHPHAHGHPVSLSNKESSFEQMWYCGFDSRLKN